MDDLYEKVKNNDFTDFFEMKIHSEIKPHLKSVIRMPAIFVTKLFKHLKKQVTTLQNIMGIRSSTQKMKV